MIFVVDFGSQVAHLISRRVREQKVSVQIVSPEESIVLSKKQKPSGIILSGGPSSVYQKNAPLIDPGIFSLGVPVLGICYGLQATAKALNGKVVPGRKEYGPAKLQMKSSNWPILEGLPKSFIVWMSHGDEVVELPKGFEAIGSTDDVKNAFVGDIKNRIFAVQFHPEVEHTEYGDQIINNFIKICEPKKQDHAVDLKQIEEEIKNKVGNKFVIGAVSGGVDSTVAAVITAKAIKNQFIPIYVDNGLMRDGTCEHVAKIFKHIGIKADIVNAKEETIKKLKGVEDSERKRKIIGKLYIDVFEREMKKLIKSGKDVAFLMQGTIYSDVIESKGTVHASKIKSHHNVGGLPKKMKLGLIEPLRTFYKDEVRKIGKDLGLPDEFVHKQPFPGPGYGVRIRGEVTAKRLDQERMADNIVMEELGKADVLKNVFQSFAVMTGAKSTAVKGDGRN
ncbi:glutamine-hydrolyzing GMP synthase, partial [Patescibacteria group bacterium]|nr:glutamine-hydrolyzing GMP synthase [Patescibacteria group bacterium]